MRGEDGRRVKWRLNKRVENDCALKLLVPGCLYRVDLKLMQTEHCEASFLHSLVLIC